VRARKVPFRSGFLLKHRQSAQNAVKAMQSYFKRGYEIIQTNVTRNYSPADIG